MNINKKSGDNKSSDVEELYRQFTRQRASSSDIDKVMARLADEGMLPPGGERFEENFYEQTSGELINNELLVEDAYQHYRATRAGNCDDLVGKVLEAVAEEKGEMISSVSRQRAVTEQSIETPYQHAEDKTEIVNDAVDSAPPHSVFTWIITAPGKLLDMVVSVFSAKTKRGFPQVLVPAIALTVTAFALVPWLLNQSDRIGSGDGSQMVAEYRLPDGLLAPNSGVAAGIDISSLDSLAFSATSGEQIEAYLLGQRLVELMSVAADSNADTIVVNTVFAKFNSLQFISDVKVDDDLSSEIISIRHAFSAVPVDGQVGVDSIIQFENTFVELQKPQLLSWMRFGQASEALAISARLAERGQGELLGESLSAFKAMNFSDNLPDVSEHISQRIYELDRIANEYGSGSESAGRILKLLSQIRLSIG